MDIEGSMSVKRKGRRSGRALRGLVMAAALVALLVAVGGCGSSKKSSKSSTAGGSGVAQAKAKVAEAYKPITSFSPPGPPINNVKSLAGKTVWYIPISQTAEFFNAVSSALQKALGKVGVHVRTCNGQANPSATAACVNQAVTSNAGAVIVDAIPIVVAAQAFAAAQKAKIPVLVTDQL